MNIITPSQTFTSTNIELHFYPARFHVLTVVLMNIQD